MPIYGSKKYDSGANMADVLTPGLRSVLFGALTPQDPSWAKAQGAPVWPATAETVAVGAASVAVCLRASKFPIPASVEVTFGGDPGVFEIDVQTADTDAEASYVTKQSIANAQMNTANVARVELTGLVAKFLRLKVVSFANAETVPVLATIA